ncbi:helix-turn-helix domain-containing protein [Nannocystis bainbridge]|uniref:Helix-turn-helix transcriptional regulator n=1 Tax=Nannocystis bainbridge TaxID=2995303 RepID=A0ABT5E9D7_9BACT|nr:helix-turn-helix transcriptional regulator [Nannocystis bainbridge]MDC0722474.1 helix-turn-helix transcriptional regulator [Nannocystis bainbridge]
MTKQELAERSEHSSAHVLALFDQPEPNPKLALYLELVQKAGARFHGLELNEPTAIIGRLKEIIEREQIQTVSALAKVSGINRSQLSSLLNDPEPNPTLATFDRLVVALGAEQEFLFVKFMDEDVEEAIAVGLEDVEAMKQEAKVRHLRAVPNPSSAKSAADAERAANVEVKAAVAELTARITELHEHNVALEKRIADDAAELARLRGSNTSLERLRAEDQSELDRLAQENQELVQLHMRDRAELAELTARKDWSLGRKILFGISCFAAGAGAAALVVQARDRS